MMPIKGYDCNSSFEIRQNFGKTMTSIILCVLQPTVLRAYYSKFKVANTGSLKVSLESIIDFEHFIQDNSTLNSSKVCCASIAV